VEYEPKSEAATTRPPARARRQTLRPSASGAPPMPAEPSGDSRHPRPTAECYTAQRQVERRSVLLLCGSVVDAWALGRAALRRGRDPFVACDVCEATRVLATMPIDACILDGELLRNPSPLGLARSAGTRRAAILVPLDGPRCEELTSMFANAMPVPWPSDPDHVLDATNARLVTRRPGGIDLSASSALRAALEEAAGLEVGGEVIVRAGESVGRVFFACGRIAWAVASTMATTLRDDMRAVGVPTEDYDKAFVECRRTGANLAETLVGWGLVPESRMRALLLDRITACIRELASWTGTRALFAPRPWEYKSNLTFSTADVLAAVAQESSAKAPPHDGWHRDGEHLEAEPDLGGQ
jgi:hypothetical protein